MRKKIVGALVAMTMMAVSLWTGCSNKDRQAEIAGNHVQEEQVSYRQEVERVIHENQKSNGMKRAVAFWIEAVKSQQGEEMEETVILQENKAVKGHRIISCSRKNGRESAGNQREISDFMKKDGTNRASPVRVKNRQLQT